MEVEDRITLQRFGREELKKTTKYAPPTHYMLVDGNDDRGIDVSLASRFPVHELVSHVDDMDGSAPIFSRDCLEVEVHAPGGSIWCLLNHFKSKGWGAKEVGDAKRRAQVRRVTEILQRFDLTKDRVVVLGDFNDTPDSDPISPLEHVPHLYDVLALQFGSDPSKRWTYHYRKGEQIDYLLVSEPLKDRLVSAGIERSGMFGVEKIDPTVTPLKMDGKKDEASDHAAVWADFAIA